MPEQESTTRPLGLPICYPASVESDTDVNAFADAMVSVMERAQAAIQEDTDEENPGDNAQLDSPDSGLTHSGAEQRNTTSTTVSDVSHAEGELSLTTLETTLQVATSSRTILPVLLPAHSTSAIGGINLLFQLEDDSTSSVCDAPPLPCGTSDVKFSTDPSEGVADWRRRGLS